MAHLRPTGQIREGDSPETWNLPLLFFCLQEAGETVEKPRGETEREGKSEGKEGKTETGVN